jgi:hypothetical protein
MTLNTGTGALFPAPVSGTSFFKLTLIDAATGQISEIVHVTARTGDTLTIVRARRGHTGSRVVCQRHCCQHDDCWHVGYILDNYATIASLGTGSSKERRNRFWSNPDMSFLVEPA